MSRAISLRILVFQVVFKKKETTYRPNSELQQTIQRLLSTSPAWLKDTSTFCVYARYETSYRSIASAVVKDAWATEAGGSNSRIEELIGVFSVFGGDLVPATVEKRDVRGGTGAGDAESSMCKGCFECHLSRSRPVVNDKESESRREDPT